MLNVAVFLLFLGVTSAWIHGCVLGHEWISLVSNISLQLSLQLVDFITQVCNDVLIGGDVLADHLFVRFYTHLDILCPVGVLESVDRLLVLTGGRRACGNHDCFAVATERIFEHSRQLAVSEWHEETLLCLVTQRINAIS